MSDMGHQGGHGGHIHAGHGGDGAGASHALGLEHGHQQHGFFSHLLGLDHDHGHGAHAGHNHGHQHGQQAGAEQGQGAFSWSSSLQSLKLSDIFQGLNVTPNVMLLLLFAGFAVWIFVVYWVRHHEPLTNQVLGTGGGYASTAHADRKIVAGIRHALPLRTSANTGTIYVPITGTDAQPPNPASGAFAAAPPLHAGYPAVPAQAAPQAVAPLVARPALQPSLTAVGPVAVGHSLSAHPAVTARGAYCVPIHTADGTRLKTVTNR